MYNFLNSIINNFIKVVKIIRNTIRRLFFNDIYKRLERIEYQSFNRRFYAIEQVAEYLVGARIPGYYVEFGVSQGTTFIHAWKLMSPLLRR